VGAGISGLAVAWFYRERRPEASILILDNHDDFGGHAKRNEFVVDGRFLLGYGGSEALQSPDALYGPEAKRLLAALGVDHRRFETYFDRDLYPSLGLSRGQFFSGASRRRRPTRLSDAATPCPAYTRAVDVLIDAGIEALTRATEDNLRGWLPVFERLDGAHLEEIAGCARWTSSMRLPLFNGVIGAPAGGDLRAAVDEILRPFDDGDIPLLWVLPPSVDLTAELRARGFEADPVPGMTLDLTSLPPLEPPPGTDVEEVDGEPGELRDALQIALTTNGMPDEAIGPFLSALDVFPDRSTIKVFLATLDGVPAATSTLLLAAGVAGLYNVGTVPTKRRRGLGRLVSLAAMHAGRAAGFRYGVLQASALGDPVYRSMGFQERGRFTFAIRGPRGV
jgi:NAD(P)-binding Rossmann-like domain